MNQNDVWQLAQVLRDAESAHKEYERVHGKHTDWPEFYAAHILGHKPKADSAYQEQTDRQNLGLECVYCGSISGHFDACPLIQNSGLALPAGVMAHLPEDVYRKVGVSEESRKLEPWEFDRVMDGNELSPSKGDSIGC